MSWLVSCPDTCVSANVSVAEIMSWLHHWFLLSYSRLGCLLQVQQWNGLPAVLCNNSVSLNTFKQSENASLLAITNLIQRCCGFSVILAPWHKCQGLLIYLLTYSGHISRKWNLWICAAGCLQARCPSCDPTNIVKAWNERQIWVTNLIFLSTSRRFFSDCSLAICSLSAFAPSDFCFFTSSSSWHWVTLWTSSSARSFSWTFDDFNSTSTRSLWYLTNCSAALSYHNNILLAHVDDNNVMMLPDTVPKDSTPDRQVVDITFVNAKFQQATCS